MSWVIVYSETNQYVGWPEPLVFGTKKEARSRLDKIAHQLRGFGVDLSLKEVSLPVNSHERFKKWKRGRRSGKYV